MVKAPPAPKLTAWEKFDAAERQKRIDEFVKGEQEAVMAEYDALPSVRQWFATTACSRCGLLKSRQHVSTSERSLVDFTVEVAEVGEETILYSQPYLRHSGYFITWDGKPLKTPTVFQVVKPAYLSVECECGNAIGKYRPLDA